MDPPPPGHLSVNSLLIKTNVNLPNKTLFANENWKQLLIIHALEYWGWSKLYVNIILATLYISLCDPICIFFFVNEEVYIPLIKVCVKSEFCRTFPFHVVTPQRCQFFHYFVCNSMGTSSTDSPVDSSYILNHKSLISFHINLKVFVFERE